jgi:hypothetical protein
MVSPKEFLGHMGFKFQWAKAIVGEDGKLYHV